MVKVRDLIEQEICVDVVDDVCEELYIAMDGPIRLTEDGEKKFSEVLDYGVKLHFNGRDIVEISKMWNPFKQKAAVEEWAENGGQWFDQDRMEWVKDGQNH